MEKKTIKISKTRYRRKLRVRGKIRGTADRPRLTVFRSSRKIYAQLIDDNKQSTLAAASSLSAELKKSLKGKETKLEVGRLVGLLLAQKAEEQGIKKVAFDRGSYLYHGRVKALAQGAREGGLEF